MLENVQSHRLEDQLQGQLKTTSDFDSWREQAQQLDV
jgi:hypothetical protein